MSRIDDLVNGITDIYRDAHQDIWQKAEEAGGIIQELAPATRKSMIRAVRDQVMEEQKSICPICSGSLKNAIVHEDHIIPVSYGGGNEKSNMRLVHAHCNLQRGNDLYEYVEMPVFIQYVEDRIQNLPPLAVMAHCKHID